MKKDIIIAGLIFSNLVLIAALIYVWTKGRGFPEIPVDPNVAAPIQRTGPQEFTFRARGRFRGEDVPQIVNRALTITATFDTQENDGVIIAQGGLAQGYALYVQNGELFFALRRLSVLTTLSGGRVSAGQHTVTAALSKAGELTLARDGNASATGLAAGVITAQPVDGLDIGADQGAPVGPYETPNSFGGTIEMVSVKTVP